MTKDPLGISGGDVNLYRYVANSPYQGVDPFGFFTVALTLDGIASAGKGGGVSTGAYVSFPIPFTDDNSAFDAGTLTTIGTGDGIIAGAGVSVSAYGGDIRDVVGAGSTVNAGVGFGGSAIYNSDSELIGGSTGILGPTFGASTNSTLTGANSLQYGSFQQNASDLFCN